MDRKKTILIAILINAGLLVLLFIMALYREEEDPRAVDASHTLAMTQKQPPVPLFNDIQETPIRSIAEPPSLTPPAVLEPVIHQLPPLASQVIAPPPVVETPQLAVASSSKTIEVTVKKGDTMDKIAKAYHTTVDEIIRLNHLPSTFLRIGQMLKVPTEPSLTHLASKPKPPVSNSVPSDAQSAEYYIVKVGDNPTKIAEKHHIKVEELLKINHLNEEKARKLKPGDRLRVN